jgi:hypothetical protein
MAVLAQGQAQEADHVARIVTEQAAPAIEGLRDLGLVELTAGPGGGSTECRATFASGDVCPRAEP